MTSTQLQRVGRIILSGTAAVVFLFYVPSAEMSVGLTKVWILEIGLLLLLGMQWWFAEAWIPLVQSAWQRYRIACILLLLFLGMSLVSTLLAPNLAVALFGRPFRIQGWITLVFYILFVFEILWNIPALQDARELAWGVVGGGALVSLLGLFQWFWPGIFGLTSNDIGVESTLGHPSFLGSALIFWMGWTVMVRLLDWWPRSPAGRVAFGIIFGLEVVVLFLTWTRTAWLAGIILIVGFCGVLFWKLTSRQRWMTLGSLGIGIFGLIVLATTFQLLPSFLEKSSIIDFSSGTGRLRVLWWGQAWQAIQERPFFGWGPDGQEVALLKYSDPEEWLWAGVNVYADRAHNEYLDLLLTLGAGGFAVFIFFILTTVKRAWTFSHPSTPERTASLLLCLILVSHAVQSLAIFATTSVWLLFWITIAMFIILGHRMASSQVASPSWRRPLVWHAGGVLLTFAFFVFVFRVPLQDRSVDRVEAASKIPVYEEMLAALHADEHAQPLLRWSAKEQVHHLAFLEYILDRLDPELPISTSLLLQGEFRQRWPAVQDQTLRPIEEHLAFAVYLSYLAQEDPSVIPKMNEQFHRTEQLAPFWEETQRAWITALNDVGQPEEALGRIAKLEELLPDPYDDRILYDYLSLQLLNIDGLLNIERGRAWEKKGELQFAERAYKIAATQLEKPQTAFHHLAQLDQAVGLSDKASPWRALKSRWTREERIFNIDLIENRF
jgi:O-antigen ligase